MNEIERVKNMLEQGTITANEAERLIAVLEEVDGVERDLEAVGAAADAAEPGRTDSDQVSPEPAADASDAALGWPDAGRWVRISMLAGDLDVRLDEGIDEPVVRSADGATAAVKLEPAGDGYRIAQFGGTQGDLLGRLMGGLRRSDLDVRLPPGFNLQLDVKAGDVTVRDIPYLRGSLLAGDLDASGLRGIDLTMQAGDVDLDLAPQAGRHRVRVSAGDVTVRLRPDASVAFAGRVSIGEIRTDGDATSERSGLGASVATKVGAGDASLDVRLSTGQLTLKVHHE